jgi:hypothetical protein
MWNNQLSNFTSKKPIDHAQSHGINGFISDAYQYGAPIGEIFLPSITVANVKRKLMSNHPRICLAALCRDIPVTLNLIRALKPKAA